MRSVAGRDRAVGNDTCKAGGPWWPIAARRGPRVFHWKAHEVSVLAALIWSGVWVGLALLFRPEAGEESAVAPGCREKVANGQMADRWSPMPRM